MLTLFTITGATALSSCSSSDQTDAAAEGPPPIVLSAQDVADALLARGPGVLQALRVPGLQQREFLREQALERGELGVLAGHQRGELFAAVRGIGWHGGIICQMSWSGADPVRSSGPALKFWRPMPLSRK